MKTQTIVFVSPGIAQLQTRDLREPGADEVLVKLMVSSISSGTERANLIGERNVSVVALCEEVVFPRIVGYSSSGVVEKVGEGVTELKVGDRVALAGSIHSQYVVMNQKNVHKLADEISFEEAALWYIGTFPLAAIRKCKLEMGESAIVMGMGILGLIAVKLLRAAGAAPIIAVDPNPEKRQLSLKYGADYAVDPFASDFAENVKALTDGGASVAIEVTGNGGGLNGALDCMKRFGRVALLGCTRDSNFSVDYYHKVHGPGISLIGAHNNARPDEESYPGYWTNRDDMKTLHRMSKCGRLDLGALIQETYSPKEAPQVFARLAKDSAFPVVQFDWRRI